MQITCPSCAADYAVPDEKLSGRAVKCARCGAQWNPMLDAAPVVLHPDDAPSRDEPPGPIDGYPRQDALDRAEASQDAPNPHPPGQYAPLFGAQWPMADQSRPAPLYSDQPPAYRAEAPQQRSKGLIVAWMLTIVILGGAAIGGFVNRDAIMQAWPPSQRAYALFGLHQG